MCVSVRPLLPRLILQTEPYLGLHTFHDNGVENRRPDGVTYARARGREEPVCWTPSRLGRAWAQQLFPAASPKPYFLPIASAVGKLWSPQHTGLLKIRKPDSLG